MAKLTIDNQFVEVPDGTTILYAAEQLGIDIPTMCYIKDFEPSASCMMCIVQIEGSGDFVPSCAAIVEDGMVVTTDNEQIREARKTALELLLSDHYGDCMGPCHLICPAQMNIPLMIRQIAAGQLTEAIKTVKKDIALPAVLGRICPAPCEKGCRRSFCDEPVSICLLKRFVADVDLNCEQPYRPECNESTGKKVAVIGAGPAGLAAAYYLKQRGVDVVIYDKNEQAGGMLRYQVNKEFLPVEVLEKEIQQIIGLGIELKLNTEVDKDITFDEIKKSYDAVFIAIGNAEHDFNVEKTDKGIVIDKKTYQTSVQGVFAGGDIVRQRKLTVRSVADGKEAAVSICQYLAEQQVTGVKRPFNTRIGKIDESETQEFLKTANNSGRTSPENLENGFTGQQAIEEAKRCLHCDCRKADNCKLRDYSDGYGVSASHFKYSKRKFEQCISHPQIIYESGKCIDCGICVKIAAQQKEQLGLTFIGRGFDVRVAVPFDNKLKEALITTGGQCVRACPTGALAFK